MMANILADGSVVPCCYDFDASMAVGNAFQESFTSLWNSAAYASCAAASCSKRALCPLPGVSHELQDGARR